jgi:membrane associated rhomboid family serine protease
MLPLRDHLPRQRVPYVNYALIGINVAVFVLELLSAPGGTDSSVLVERGALVPRHLFADPAAAAPTLVTHMFVHASFLHIGGNMLYLWIFGDNVEDALGHVRYVFFYFLCGIAAAFAQVALAPGTEVPMLGASGAISGVLAAYALLYPRAPVMVLNPIPLLWVFWGLFFWVPAWLVIGIFFVANLLSALRSPNGTASVAFAAHVGGFLAGVVLLLLLRKHPPVEHPRWTRWRPPRGERRDWTGRAGGRERWGT